MSKKQEDHIMELLRSELHLLCPSKKEGKAIVDYFKFYLREFLSKATINNDIFGSPIAEIDLMIPKDYDHDSLILDFLNEVKGSELIYMYESTPGHLLKEKCVEKLIPGQTYVIKVHPILKEIRGNEITKFLRQQDAILVGFRGLIMLHRHKWENLLSLRDEHSYYASFTRSVGMHSKISHVDHIDEIENRIDISNLGRIWDSSCFILSFHLNAKTETI